MLYFFYNFSFFAIPAVLIGFFGFSLYGYLTAKKRNRALPGSFSPGEMKKRKLILILSSVMMGVLVAIVIGFMILLSGAIAFM